MRCSDIKVIVILKKMIFFIEDRRNKLLLIKEAIGMYRVWIFHWKASKHNRLLIRHDQHLLLHLLVQPLAFYALWISFFVLYLSFNSAL